MADHNVIPFEFETHTLSVITDATGDPWWIGAEVCAILELPNVSKALSRLDPDEKSDITLSDVAGRPNKALIVNESGLYSLILGSRKKSAKAFKRWVTHEVLPQIRKTGRYESQPKSSGDMLVEMALAYRDQEKRLLAVEAQQRQAEILQRETQTKLIHAQEMALTALRSMQWVTIRQYVEIYALQAQASPSIQRAFATWLTTYCLEQGQPMYKAATADKEWPYEKTYCIAVIHQTFGDWLTRRHLPRLVQPEQGD